MTAPVQTVLGFVVVNYLYRRAFIVNTYNILLYGIDYFLVFMKNNYFIISAQRIINSFER